MQRDDAVLLDVLRAARRCQDIAARVGSEAAFLADEDAQGNMLYWMIVVGEAVRRLSDTFVKQHSNIPWRKIVDMRNRLVHRYDDVDLTIVWESAQRDIPLLIAYVDPLVPRDEGSR